MLQTLFGFRGRLRRSHYWAVGLIMTFVVAPLIGGLIAPLLPHGDTSDIPLTGENEVGYGLLTVFVALYVWVRLAILTKRLHDRDKSGWLMMIVLIPVLGVFWGLWMCIECAFFDGDPGGNKYGPSPKDPSARPQPAVLGG